MATIALAVVAIELFDDVVDFDDVNELKIKVAIDVVDATNVRVRAWETQTKTIPAIASRANARERVRFHDESIVAVTRHDDRIDLAIVVNGKEFARASLALNSLCDDVSRAFDATRAIAGVWVQAYDANGRARGRACARARVMTVKTPLATNDQGKENRTTAAHVGGEDAREEDADASVVVETSDGSASEDERASETRDARAGNEDGRRATTTERVRKKNPLSVVGRFLKDTLTRQSEDEVKRREEKERARDERERDIEANKVEKARAKYEGEENKGEDDEREETRRISDEREGEETARRATTSTDGTSSTEIVDAPSAPDKQLNPASAMTHDKAHHLPAVHLPNVEDIKHQVHHIQDILRDHGGRLRRNLDEQVHHIGEKVHHFGDAVGEKVHHAQENIRDTSGKVGKTLAKNKLLRAIAKRISPNSILMLAIAFFLAGLPENRVRKVQGNKQRILRSQVQQQQEKERREEELRQRELAKRETYVEYEEGAEAYDDADEPAYVGRGPTPRGVYEIVEGDTLCSIAGCFNLALVEIIDKNGDVITNPDALEPGARIRIY